MKKILLLTICLVMLLQVSAFAESKVGVFQMQKVVLECDYGKAVLAQLKAKFEPLEAEIKKEDEAIQKLAAELKKQDLALKLEAKQDKQREYRRKMRDLQDSYTAYQQKQQVEQQRLLAPIKERVGKAIAAYSMANGFTIVFEMQVAGVIYIDKGVDISDAVIAELNKMKKAGK